MEVPDNMKSKGRPPDEIFAANEHLYRRIHPDHFDGNEIAIEAFELPDMSVNREKYGPPQWARLFKGCEQWGVASFRVGDIPQGGQWQHLGVMAYLLQVEHIPLSNNYPHSEVRVYLDDQHISRANNNAHLLHPEFHIRWREKLCHVAKIAIPPEFD